MIKHYFKRFAPYMIMILLFLIVCFIYFKPMLEGKTLVAHDSQSWITSSHEALEWKEKTGHNPLWTNSMFSGMPTFQITPESPYNIFTYVSKVLTSIPRPAYFLFMYLIGGYILLLCFGINPWLSGVGSVALAFGSYNFIIIAAGHSTKASVIALSMMVIGSIILILRNKKLLGACLLALFLGLAILFNHVQILYYALFIILILLLVEFIFSIKEKNIPLFFRKCAYMLVPLLLAISINASLLLTTYDYAKQTMRGESTGLTLEKADTQEGLSKDYITEWSYGIDETMTLLIPNYKGGASIGKLKEDSHTASYFSDISEFKKLGRDLSAVEKDRLNKSLANNNFNPKNLAELMYAYDLPLYFGDQRFTSGPVYLGAIVIFLFIVGLFIVPQRYRWWLLAATILSVLLSWGKNFMPLTNFFIDYIPLYNKFRAVSMTLVIAGITVPLMAILALREILLRKNIQSVKIGVYASLFITGGICLLYWLFPETAGDFKAASDSNFQGQMAFLQETLPLDRKDMLSNDALRSLIFIMLSAAGILLFVYNKIQGKWLVAAMAVLFLADMYPIDRRYLNESNFTKKQNKRNFITPDFADRFILQDTNPSYRVLDITVDVFNNSTPSYFHKNIGGYHAAKLRRYQDLINIHLEQEIINLTHTLSDAAYEHEIQEALQLSPVLNMLNMKYLKYHPEAHPVINSHAMGNAWFIENIKTVNSADEEILALSTTDLQKTIVCDNSLLSSLSLPENRDPNASISLKTYEPDKMTYTFKSNTDQIAVFSEIYYDNGWKAYINGKEVPHIRANYLLRAMPLDAGDYEIVFEFKPTSFKTGNMISGVGSIIFVIMLGGIIYLTWRKKKKDE